MSSGLIISVEVIHLLKWIMEHGQDELNGLVIKAIGNGCLDIDDNARFDSAKNLADFHHVILSVIASLENSVDKYAASAGNITPAVEMLLEKLRGCNFDPELIISSVRTTSLNIGKSAKKSEAELPAQEDVLKSILANLLKKWKPGKKDALA